MSGLRFAPLEEVATERVVDLLGLVLGQGPLGRTREVFDWKHRRNPFGPSWGRIAIDEETGDPAAVRLFQRWRLRSGERALLAARAVDTATHPKWRRRGLFRDLTLDLLDQIGEEGASLVFNTPNPRSRAGYVSMGWRSLGRVPVLARPLRPLRVGRALLRRGGAPRHQDAVPLRPAPCRPITELLDDAELEHFLGELWSGEARLHVAKTTDYLRWRYSEFPVAGDLPGMGYGALWNLTPEAGAVIVARVRRRRGLRELGLCEVLVRGGTAGVGMARDLIARAARHSDADYLIGVAARGSSEHRSLRAAGLFPAGARGPHLVAREVGERVDVGAFSRWESWRLSLGDLELF